MPDFAEFIKAFLEVFRRSPVAAAVVCVAAAGIGAYATHLYYAERIEVLNLRIDDYQERLGIVPRDFTKYSKLTDRELIRETQALVVRLRDVEKRRAEREDQHSAKQFKTFRNGELDVDAWNEWTAEGAANMSIANEELNPFLAEARALTAELETRSKIAPRKGTYIQDLPRSAAEVVLKEGRLMGVDPIGNLATWMEQLAKNIEKGPPRP